MTDAERWVEVLAVCIRCSVVAQVLWNSIGEPGCESCGRPLMVSVIREATPEQAAEAMEASEHD